MRESANEVRRVAWPNHRVLSNHVAAVLAMLALIVVLLLAADALGAAVLEGMRN